MDLQKSLELANIKLVAVEKNLIDQVWGTAQPERPNQAIIPLPMKYTGRSWEDKVCQVREMMTLKKKDALVLTALDDVAWLLNLRGSDIVYNPVFFSYVVVQHDRIFLFVNKEQVIAVRDVCHSMIQFQCKCFCFQGFRGCHASLATTRRCQKHCGDPAL